MWTELAAALLCFAFSMERTFFGGLVKLSEILSFRHVRDDVTSIAEQFVFVLVFSSFVGVDRYDRIMTCIRRYKRAVQKARIKS